MSWKASANCGKTALSSFIRPSQGKHGKPMNDSHRFLTIFVRPGIICANRPELYPARLVKLRIVCTIRQRRFVPRCKTSFGHFMSEKRPIPGHCTEWMKRPGLWRDGGMNSSNNRKKCRYSIASKSCSPMSGAWSRMPGGTSSFQRKIRSRSTARLWPATAVWRSAKYWPLWRSFWSAMSSVYIWRELSADWPWQGSAWRRTWRIWCASGVKRFSSCSWSYWASLGLRSHWRFLRFSAEPLQSVWDSVRRHS